VKKKQFGGSAMKKRAIAWAMLPVLLLASSTRGAPVDDARLRGSAQENSN